jgi:hypothetical protein
MITGPARFPTARNQKRSQWADNKANDLLEWDKKASAAIKRKLLDARPEEEKDAAEWRQLANEITRSLNVIEGIDERGDYWTRSAFVNSIAGKVERLALGGDVALVDKALELVKAYGEKHKKPAITDRHNFWTFSELSRQKAAEAATKAVREPEVAEEGKGVKIVCNAAIDRVQIVFDQKPDAAMIASLKSEAWNWSRREGAWQRKLTEAAKQSAKRIIAEVKPEMAPAETVSMFDGQPLPPGELAEDRGIKYEQPAERTPGHAAARPVASDPAHRAQYQTRDDGKDIGR